VSGPTATVLCAEALSTKQIEDISGWLRRISSDVRQEQTTWTFSVLNGASFGLPYTGQVVGCQFSMGVENVNEWYSADELSQMEGCLHFVPKQQISIGAGCSAQVDHLLLGHIALDLARQLNGWVSISGALTPSGRPPEGRERDDYVRGWTLDEIKQYLNALPGVVCEILYQTSPDKHSIYHVVDQDFLHAWLQHPDFHMVK